MKKGYNVRYHTNNKYVKPEGLAERLVSSESSLSYYRIIVFRPEQKLDNDHSEEIPGKQIVTSIGPI